MATAVQEQWLKDVLGLDVAAQGKQGQQGPAAVTSGTAGHNGDGEHAPVPDMGASGEVAANGPAGAGEQPKTKAKATFKLVSSSHPTVDVPEEQAAGAAPADDAEPSGGDAKADAIGKVIDKVVEIGEKVVTAIAKHSSITDSGKTLSVLPEHTQPSHIKSGAIGKTLTSFKLVGGFNNSLADLTIEINYMVCTVFGSKGRFLKDIRMIVRGSVFPGVTVDIRSEFGEPGNTGPSPKEWIVDLLVDIKTHWNSIYIFDGEDAYRVRLNAARGGTIV